MNINFDADKPHLDSPLPVRSTRSNRKLTPAQRHKYQREIAIYRGMFGGTDVAAGDVEAWAAFRATVPEMVELDREIATYRRSESRLWHRRATQRKAQEDGV